MDGLTQFFAAPGAIDLAWGHPDPDLLPVAELRAATSRALDRYGPDMLAYGHPLGPLPLREWIGARLAETDARAPTPDEIVITGGTSQGLDMVATLMARPDDAFLIGEPTYHLAVRILADHPVPMHGVASDGEGLLIDELAATVRRLRDGGARRLFLYLIPTFNNPTGTSLPEDRRRALANLAAAEDLVILEDDTYRELAYEGAAPPSLWSIAEPGTVVRLGSFAKSVAPGLRCGYLTVDAPTAARFALSGFLDSGGSPSQFSALTLVEYAAAGDYARVVERYRAAYRKRRDALTDGLPRDPAWVTPKGGYFLWLPLPEGVDAGRLIEMAERCGTGFIPASVFYVHPDRAPRAIRLAFSRYPPDQLAEGTRRLASAIELARVPAR